MRRVSGWMERRPVAAFYILAFAITWLAWVPQALHSHGLFPFDSPLFYVVGGAGPLLALNLVLRVTHGPRALGRALRGLGRWHVHPLWYVAALLGYPALWLASLALSGDLRPFGEAFARPLALLPALLVAFIAAIPEEAGWRGFALPELRDRHGRIVATLIVGVLWAAWHLPLLLNADNPMSSYPLVAFAAVVVARSFVYAWLFEGSGGSVLLVTLFHAMSNAVGTFVPAEVVVAGVAALLIVAWWKGRPLAVTRRPVMGVAAR